MQNRYKSRSSHSNGTATSFTGDIFCPTAQVRGQIEVDVPRASTKPLWTHPCRPGRVDARSWLSPRPVASIAVVGQCSLRWGMSHMLAVSHCSGEPPAQNAHKKSLHITGNPPTCRWGSLLVVQAHILRYSALIRLRYNCTPPRTHLQLLCKMLFISSFFKIIIFA